MAYDADGPDNDIDDDIEVDSEFARELLDLCATEMRSAIGFENDADLIQQRERATLYRRGVMNDYPALANRSRVVSTDISDAVLTVMPDLIEIFTGGDDVLAFQPSSEADTDQAEQETDYVSHTVFNENDGWMLLYTCLDDALVNKTALAKYWWDEGEDVEPSIYKGKTLEEVAFLYQDAGDKHEIEVTPAPASIGAEQLFDVALTPPKSGKVCIAPWDPNDFAICRDATIKVGLATYCATRARPRAQDLIAQGIDKALVDTLETWSPTNVNAADLAKDTVNETQIGADNTGDLRQVYVAEHSLKLIRGGKTQVYQILSDYNCSHALRIQKVNRVQLAAGTAFINAHRFYGRSLADLLVEIQRVKTFLMRMIIDSGLFAINQRPLVNMNQINEFTLADLLNNIPGAPIRVDGEVASAVQMMGGEALNYNPLEHLEYFNTVSEARTGVVRNSQGLNPDTLHDTAAGAAMLADQAMKRVKTIARTLAETFLKDLYLGVHATLCENATDPREVKLRGKWITVNPSEWARRTAMTVEIGVGAANRQHNLMAMQAIGAAQAQMVEGQGGINGPLVNPAAINAAAIDLGKALGRKNPEKYFPDPAKYQAPPPPPPDPKIALEQEKLALEKQKLEGELSLQSQRQDGEAQLHAARLETEQQKIALEHEHKQQQLAVEADLNDKKISGEFNLKQYQIDQQTLLAREQMVLEMARHSDKIDIEQQKIDASPDDLPGGPRVGGDQV